ncbi:MAG: hypothetical protein AB7E48_00395 [Deferribacterales bacterium]
MSDKDTKGKIIDLFKEAKKRKKPLGNTSRASQKVKGDGNLQVSSRTNVSQSIEGNNNVQIAGSNNQFITNVNPKITEKHVIAPQPDDITPAQQLTVRTKIEELVDLDTDNTKTRQGLYKKWYGVLCRRFKVTKYNQLKQVDFPTIQKYLNSQIARLRKISPNITSNQVMKDWQVAIHVRLKEKGYKKNDAYIIAQRLLDVEISSLKELNFKQLEKLYTYVMSIK